MIKVFLLDVRRNVWNFIGETEMLLNQPNPKFTTPIGLDYHFEEKQMLKFMVLDVDDMKAAKVTTADLVKGADFIGYKVS